MTQNLLPAKVNLMEFCDLRLHVHLDQGIAERSRILYHVVEIVLENFDEMKARCPLTSSVLCDLCFYVHWEIANLWLASKWSLDD